MAENVIWQQVGNDDMQYSFMPGQGATAIEEWLVCLLQSMYENAKNNMHVGCNLIEEFSVKVIVHKGSYLSPILFITVLKAFCKSFILDVPRKTFIIDLIIIAALREELQEKLIHWKSSMKRMDFGSAWAKSRSRYLGQQSICFRCPAMTPVPCVSLVLAQTAASVTVVPVGSTRGSVVSLVSLVYDRGHSGKGEAWGGTILLLPWGLLILRWYLSDFH